MHYRRMRKTGETGDIEPLYSRNCPEKWEIEQCNHPHVAKGLCRHHYRKKWYAQNQESVAEYNADYYLVNRDRYAEWNRSWAKKNRRRKTSRASAWRAANYEHYIAYQADWRKNNCERTREYQQRRRERQQSATVITFTFDEWMQRVEYYGGKCWICKTADYQEDDHVKPLAKGGAHMLSNLRPACTPCNRKKSSIWPFDVITIRESA